MNLIRRLERLVKRRDPEEDRSKAADVVQRTKRLTEDNRAVVDDIRKLERGLNGR